MMNMLLSSKGPQHICEYKLSKLSPISDEVVFCALLTKLNHDIGYACLYSLTVINNEHKPTVITVYCDWGGGVKC